jgi:hypothetical protein
VNIALHRTEAKCIQNVDKTIKWTRLFATPSRNQNDNIKINVKKIQSEAVEWINLV